MLCGGVKTSSLLARLCPHTSLVRSLSLSSVATSAALPGLCWGITIIVIVASLYFTPMECFLSSVLRVNVNCWSFSVVQDITHSLIHCRLWQ